MTLFLSRWQAIIASILAYFVLPFIVLLGLWSFRDVSLINKLLTMAAAGSFIFFLYWTGSWETLNIYPRYIFELLYYVLALAITLLPSVPAVNVPHAIFALIVTIVFGYLSFRVICAIRKPQHTLNLQFPFRGGVYLITDGGDGAQSSWMNYHYKAGIHQGAQTHRSMRYATDIVKLNRWGFSYRRLLIPKINEEFEIYEEPVYSPCQGVVVEIVDGIDDNRPFSRDYPYNVGNHIVFRGEGDVYIIMGHLKAGTLKVKPGMSIEAGTLLGLIGSSGLSPRPHIHMQAVRAENGDYWAGQGIPMVFEGKFPYKNRCFVARH